jgi:hypothetical protein
MLPYLTHPVATKMATAVGIKCKADRLAMMRTRG